MEIILFGLFSGMSIAAALAMLLLKTPIYSALSLVFCMMGIAGLFALMDAHFLAVIQVIVYAGAIMVLVLFVIMLLNVNSPLELKRNKFTWGLGLFSAVCLGCFMIPFVQKHFDSGEINYLEKQIEGSVEAFGNLLFKDYLFTFELASVLILSALIGAVIIAKSDKEIEEDSQ